MRKIVVIGLCLGLAGCAGTSREEISATAKQIQEYTKLACSFVPTIGTIANILSTGVATPAIAIANEICLAVSTAPLADGGRRIPKVNGVVIKGSFVK